MPNRPILPLLVCIAWLATSPDLAAQERSEAPSGWFGNVYLGGDRSTFDASKVFAISYRIAAGSMTAETIDLAYGHVSRLPSAGTDYVVELVAADGRTLASQSANDPRVVIVERQGNVTLDSGLLTVRLAFDPSAAKLRLKRASDGAVIESDVAFAVQAFCRRNGDDPSCARFRSAG